MITRKNTMVTKQAKRLVLSDDVFSFLIFFIFRLLSILLRFKLSSDISFSNFMSEAHNNGPLGGRGGFEFFFFGFFSSIVSFTKFIISSLNFPNCSFLLEISSGVIHLWYEHEQAPLSAYSHSESELVNPLLILPKRFLESSHLKTWLLLASSSLVVPPLSKSMSKSKSLPLECTRSMLQNLVMKLMRQVIDRIILDSKTQGFHIISKLELTRIDQLINKVILDRENS